MANIFGAILSNFKKKKDEEEQIAPTPTPTKVPTVQPSQGGGIGNAIKNAWGNFWKPVPTIQANQANKPLDTIPGTGIRARDMVREIPGAAYQVGTEYFTQPVARAIQTTVNSVERAIGAGDGVTTSEEIAQAVPNKTARDILYGDKPITSLQEITERRSPQVEQALKGIGLNNKLAETTSKPITFIGAAGLTAVDALPGDPSDLVKGGGKAVLKEGAEAGAKETIETVVKNADELAPLIQRLPQAARGTLDDALVSLKEQGFKVADDVMKKLKSGKVLDGDGYVIQANDNGLIANFEKRLANVFEKQAPKVATEKVAQEAGEQVAKDSAEILQDAATRKVDDVAQTTARQGEEIADTSKQITGEEALKQADEGIPGGGKPETPGGSTPDGQTPEEYIASRPVFENLTDEQKDTLIKSLEESGFASKLNEVKGKPLTRDEVIQEALKIQDGLANPTTRKQTLDTAAKLQNTQNRIAQLSVQMAEAAKNGNTELVAALDAQMTDELLKQRSFASQWGRLGTVLQSPGDLNLPTGQKILSQVIGKVDDAQIDSVVKAWNSMTPEMKNNPEAIREFYFKFVEPTSKDLADEYRYINLLSSPLTHVRNIVGNLLAGGIEEPVTQISRGVIDRVATTLKLQPERQTYAREGFEYVGGMLRSFPQALQDAKDVISGKTLGTSAFEEGRIPIGKYAERAQLFTKEGRTKPIRQAAGKATGFFLEKGSGINRALEGVDRFFKTMVEGGYTAAKTATGKRLGQDVESGEFLANMAKGAKEKSLDLTFQNPLEPGSNASGYLHQATDVVINGLMKARNAPGVIGQAFDVVFPFLQIAGNVFNRTIDYLPGVGALNLIGAESTAAKEIAARQLTGSVAFLGSLWAVGRLAQEDRIAGAAPRDPEGRKNFLAAHPEYSVQMPDGTWVQTGNLGVFGKLVETAVRYNEGRYHENNLTDSQLEDMAQALAGTVVDMSDQSYLESLGLMIDSFKNFGQPEGSYALKNLASTPLRQNVPLAGFQGWLSKVIDPTNRKSEAINPDNRVANAFAGVLKNIPFMSYMYEPYLNPDYTESKTSRFNAILPFKVQEGNEVFSTIWGADRMERQVNSAASRFNDGLINLEDYVQTILNASSYFAGQPGQDIDLGDAGELTIPNRDKLIAQAIREGNGTQGFDLGSLFGSGGGTTSARISSKTKLSSPPKAVALKTPRIKLPSASKSGSGSTTGVSLASLTPPPSITEREIGAQVLRETANRKRSGRGVYLS